MSRTKAFLKSTTTDLSKIALGFALSILWIVAWILVGDAFFGIPWVGFFVGVSTAGVFFALLEWFGKHIRGARERRK